MKKRRLYVIGGILVLGAAVLWFFLSRQETQSLITAKVKSGEFKITVTTTGELEAKSSEKIYGPSGLRTVGIWQVKIENIIPEGTVVDSGAFVASLDRTEVSNRLKDLQSELEKLQSQYTKTKLDTSLEMRSARDELVNLRYSLEEAKITLEQSKFESPATIRQVTIEQEKQERAYDQAQKNYRLRYEKAKANMTEVSATLGQKQRSYENMMKVAEEFTINAPKGGMVIYKRSWDGTKMGVGATLSAWENVVATLPDLSSMISKTYVNEVDISKIKAGQKVDIGVDAFPDKKFTGVVFEVANIGEEIQGSNAKVFEVKIRVNEFDSILRPAMTTKNGIITATVPKVIFIPIEALHSEDSLSYVFVKDGRKITKQEVKVGQSNENEIIITQGLKADEVILLSLPDKPESFAINRLKNK